MATDAAGGQGEWQAVAAQRVGPSTWPLQWRYGGHEQRGQLTIIDARARREIKRLDVGGYAIGVEITPDGKRAFVGCEHADGLHVVDMDALSVEAVLKIGNGPDPMLIWFAPGN